MTNLIAILHTTAAYQAAVVQLMVGEANFVAKQLELKDTVPTRTNDLVEWNVSPPPLGVGGDIVTTNFIYNFEHGRLVSVSKRDWLRKAAPGASNLLALVEQPARLDTNSVTDFATQALARLQLDLAAVDQLPRHVFQIPARRIGEEGRNLPGRSNIVSTPLFQVSWGPRNPPMDLANPIRLKILGTTPEVLELRIRDQKFNRRPMLLVTNAAQLLGPLPPPRHFIEQLFGGGAAYDTVASPERVEVSLLTGRFEETHAEENRTGPVTPDRKSAAALSKALLDFDTHQWTVRKACMPDYGMKARFIRGKAVVQVRFCFDCDILEITFDGKTQTENFDFGHNDFVSIAKKLFPKDAKIRGLKSNDVKREREQMENNLKRMISD